MNSVLPEISPVAWTSYFTASGPGRHGIFGFNDFAPGGREVRFNSSADVKSPYAWDHLTLAGRRSVALNVPLTYPATPIHGAMVSGFVALDIDRAVHPPELAAFLRDVDYRLEADFERVHQDRDRFLVDLDRALTGRQRLLDRFWPEEWDLFALVVTDTDRLFHFFLAEYEENGPIADYFLDFMHRVDRLAGRVADWCDRAAEDGVEVRLFMLSDHGFSPVTHGEFHLNRFLTQQGLLPGGVPGPEAQVMALDPTRLYLNRPPRFPNGRMAAAEAEKVMDRTAGLLSGQPAVRRVFRGRDLYDGPEAVTGPDLVVLPAAGYEFKAKFNAGPVYTSSPLQGAHTFENAFFLQYQPAGSPPDAPSPPDLIEFGRTLFSSLDI
jgi:predicted AlkP superfamily phosphohydrolase/phosphomutase